MDLVRKVSHRRYSHGFWTGEAKNGCQYLESNSYVRSYQVTGMVNEEEEGYLRFVLKNKFSVGDTLEIMTPSGKTYEKTVTEILDAEGNSIPDAPHPMMTVRIPMAGSFPKYSMIRRRITD